MLALAVKLKRDVRLDRKTLQEDPQGTRVVEAGTVIKMADGYPLPSWLAKLGMPTDRGARVLVLHRPEGVKQIDGTAKDVAALLQRMGEKALPDKKADLVALLERRLGLVPTEPEPAPEPDEGGDD